jgi:hypothetical protein
MKTVIGERQDKKDVNDKLWTRNYRYNNVALTNMFFFTLFRLFKTLCQNFSEQRRSKFCGIR